MTRFLRPAVSILTTALLLVVAITCVIAGVVFGLSLPFFPWGIGAFLFGMLGAGACVEAIRYVLDWGVN